MEAFLGTVKREPIHDQIQQCLDISSQTGDLDVQGFVKDFKSITRYVTAMPDIASLIQSGATNAWLYLPVAVLLGALHALEPGHSKSVMAAFIVAVRGTPAQAVLLGVSAAIGHTIVVWALALAGLWAGDELLAERAEPWLILISGLLVVMLALRLLWMSRPRAFADPHHGHDDDNDHDHPHDKGHDHGNDHGHSHLSEAEIEQRYAGRAVRPWEIIWFGFTGGLLPCPAAIAVLLVSLHLKQFTLGITMVLAFSVGLAITLVSIGLVAAWGARKAASSWSGFGRVAARLPLLSGLMVLAVGMVMSAQGLRALSVI